MVAGNNEKKFKAEIESFYGNQIFSGKKRFIQDDVEISVDQSIEFNGQTFLFEVDSGNYAKLIVGQYVLLNLLMDEELRDKSIFVVVHYYQDYNINRTIKNLKKVNESLYNGKGIKFVILTPNQLSSILNDNSKSLVGFTNQLTQMVNWLETIGYLRN